ncbi:solute carrier family 28 member 3-like isoform X2 [Apostichopus japonicus]
MSLEFLEKGFGQLEENQKKVLKWIVFGLLGFLYFAYLIYGLVRHFHEAVPLLVITLLVVGYSLAKYVINRWGDEWKKIFKESKCMETSNQQKKVLRWAMYFFLVVFLLVMIAATGVFHSWIREPRRMVSVLGLIVMLSTSLLCSRHPTKIRWRTVFWGVYLQIFFGVLILRTRLGFEFFQWIGKEVEAFLNYTTVGATFVFGPQDLALRSFLFEILPVIIFTSAMFALFYHLGLMQIVISAFAFIMHHTMGVSGAESFGAASNVFVGCSTAPLAIKPYLNDFTTSEMHSLMVGGLATIAGSVLAIYIKFGVSAAHLLSASIMSAPASLVVAKMFIPEVDKPKTANHAVVSDCGKKSKNCFEALYNGAIDGLKICGYIIANILTILCVLALINNILQWLGELADIEGLSFQLICRYLLYPLAWILGTDPEDCMEVAELIGIKTFLNEYIAYEYLSTYIRENTITSRSQIIVTYAICGFSHVGSIGVLLGGLAPLVPDRLSEISSLCVRALVSACIACFMTACVAGFLYDEGRRYHGGSPEDFTTAPPF